MKRVAKATGGIVQSTCNGMKKEILGNCGSFDEKQIGSERYNLFTSCPKSKTATIVLRGGAHQFIEETERSLNDSIQVVKRARKYQEFVAGGGALEMELSKHLRDYSRRIGTKHQLIINGYAKALEVIPRSLCENAGIDSIEVINKLRKTHSSPEGMW